MKRSLVITFLIAGLVGVMSAQPTYTISTVGGSASNGLGDGGNAAGATLITPIDVVVDAAGNVYIADSFGASINTTAPFGTNGTGLGRIRKIDATSRNISTLTSASTVSDPKGLALDAAGKFLYVAANGQQRIVKVDTTTGAATTYAGTGSADMTDFGHLATQVRFRNPRAVWVDANGNVYFTDTQNSRVSRVDAVTGILSLVAGRGTANSSQATTSSAAAAPGGDGGPGPQGQLWSPEGVVGDNNGNLYIADTGANRIRKVVLGCTGQPVPCTVGTISTVVGLGTAGAADNVDAASAQLSGPRGLAMDATGANLYIADSGNNRIRKWVVASCGTTVNGVLTVPPVGCNQVSTVAGSGAPRTGVGDGSPALAASLANPTGVSLDSAGNIYIADQNNSRIRVVDATTGIITTLTGASQSRGDSGPASLATFSNPRGVAVDLAGNVYVTDTNNQKVRKISAGTNQIVTTYVGTGNAGNGVGAGTSTALNFPGCVAVDPTGTVYIADRVNSKIKRVDVYGNVTNAVSSNTATVSKTGVVTVGGLATGYNGDGGPAVADKVGILTGGGGFLSSGSSSNTAGPNCVSVDNNGNLYIADTGNNVIRKVDANGILSTVVGYPTVTISTSGVSSNSGIAGSEGDGGPGHRCAIERAAGRRRGSHWNLPLHRRYRQQCRSRSESSDGYHYHRCRNHPRRRLRCSSRQWMAVALECSSGLRHGRQLQHIHCRYRQQPHHAGDSGRADVHYRRWRNHVWWGRQGGHCCTGDRARWYRS